MKTTATTATMILVAAMVSGNAVAKTPARADTGRKVTVYFTDSASVPFAVRVAAQGTASKMFAEIGVTLDWRDGHPKSSDSNPIVIEYVTNTPADRLPGALAFALPFEGVHISIFWDRIGGFPVARELMAHVMVHEITHILQGVARHSDDGVMKARWTAEDRAEMKVKALSFTSYDAELINRGLDARAAGTVTRPTSEVTAAVEVRN